MRIFYFKIGVILFFGIALLSCEPRNELKELENQIVSELENEPGIFAVAFKDLTSDDELLINAHETFHAASTMKTPVLIEIYKQVSQGEIALTDSVLIKNEFESIVDGSVYSLSFSDDSEKELYGMLGTKRTISELAYDMIIVSSNLATNIIIELVDAKKVTQTMRELGAPDINVLRGVEDIKAFEQGMSNSTTAFDLMVIFEKMAQGEIVSEEASNAMIEILLDQRFNEIIPAHLPKEVKVAHKTGVISGVHHDSGIVLLPDGRKYVMVLLSKELENFDSGTATLARVSEMVYNHMMQLN